MTTENQTRPAVKTHQTGEILFNDGDVADSLFIIQKGQIRLYKPKGKGFIEIGVLRAGEVIGEMAYFSEDEAGKRRSCSATALTPVEVIEVSFSAFGKTIHSLNPWFKTILNTLAFRLRKANVRMRELEDNHTTHYGKDADHYEFLKSHDVIKVLSTLFLVSTTHGEKVDSQIQIDRKVLTHYFNDIYLIGESKFEAILILLQRLNLIEDAANKIIVKDPKEIREIFSFYTSEKHLPEDMKLNISEKCEAIMKEMVRGENAQFASIASKSNFTHQFTVNSILETLKADYSHFDDGKSCGLFGDVLEDKGRIFVETNFDKVKKLYPIVRFMNALRKTSEKPGQY